MLRVLTGAALFACTFLVASGFAANARVTDTDKQIHTLKSVRLAKGKTITIDCGGITMMRKFKTVKSMKVYPSRIKSIDGSLHFEVELTLRDGTEVGGEGGCFMSADNAVSGKSSKGKVNIPFERLRMIYVLGKEDKEEKKDK